MNSFWCFEVGFSTEGFWVFLKMVFEDKGFLQDKFYIDQVEIIKAISQDRDDNKCIGDINDIYKESEASGVIEVGLRVYKRSE